MNAKNDKQDEDCTPVYGCEFCGFGFNRPDDWNEPFTCPYCGQRWLGAAAIDEDDEGEQPGDVGSTR